jgi:ABC-2 type transport system permease protein
MSIAMNQLRTFCALLYKDYREFRLNLYGVGVNIFFQVALNLVLETFVMPSFGVAYNYGQFMLPCILVMQFVMLSMTDVSVLVDDLCTNKQVSFQLGLPLSSELVFVRYALTTAMRCFLYILLSLPVALLVVWGRSSFVSFSLLKLLFILFLGALFFGFFMLWMTSFTKDLMHYEDLWVRLVNPLWVLGGALFPWVIVQKYYPVISKILLLNPFLYLMEGARSAVLGHHQYIAYATCAGVLIFATIIVGYLGVRGMKKRLDTL